MLRCFVLPFFMLAAPGFAQEQEIVVTGRGLGSALGESVYSTVVLDRERLTGSASNRLDEILKDVPGFQLFRRSDARSANPTSQGATLRALGGNASSRALLILDGVPQSDPFGGWINWPAFDPQRLGQVRVVRGGGSGAYGPGALAGTIELFSAAPQELEGLTGLLAYGSRDSLDTRAGIGTTIGKGFLTVSASYGRGDGFMPVVAEQRGPVDRPSPYQQGSFSLRVVAPAAGRVELQASGLIFSDERERGTAFTDNRTKGADGSLRLVGRHWSALAYLQKRDYYNSFASVNAARSSVTQASEQYDVPSTGLGARIELRPAIGRVELRLGGEWRGTRGETRELFNFQNGIGTRRRIAGGETHTLGGFAEAARETGAFTLSGGARIDRWLIQGGALAETAVSTGAPLASLAYKDRAGWEPTARAGAAWRPAEGLTLRSAAYLGWRLPTLNELYRPFRVGADATAANPELEPERLQGVEAGLDCRPLPALSLGATVFANRLKEGIANVTLGAGAGTFPGVGFVAAGGEYRQRRNLDAIVTTGLELDARLDLGSWSVSGGYSFVDAEVSASGPALPLNGLRPAHTPEHSFAGTISWRGAADWKASVTARYVGPQFEDDLNQQLLPYAFTIDAAASMPLAKAVAIEMRAENIGNERVLAGIAGNGLIERATPRTIWIGLELRD
ncbi:MAG TPA: TonB-dependent receptor [Allosphingosinicella sp.]|jgi:outer membrane receptor protein involved in Fe transport